MGESEGMTLGDGLGAPYATGGTPIGRAWRAPGTGRQRLQLREYLAAKQPNTDTLRRAWKADREGAAPLLLFWQGDKTTLIVGPTAEGPQEKPTVT